jgi:hypothetical protein
VTFDPYLDPDSGVLRNRLGIVDQYTAMDLTSDGVDEAMRGREEFNPSVNIQFGQASVEHVRQRLVELTRAQYQRTPPGRGS